MLAFDPLTTKVLPQLYPHTHIHTRSHTYTKITTTQSSLPVLTPAASDSVDLMSTTIIRNESESVEPSPHPQDDVLFEAQFDPELNQSTPPAALPPVFPSTSTQEVDRKEEVEVIM